MAVALLEMVKHHQRRWNGYNMSLVKFSLDCSLAALEKPGPLFMVWGNVGVGKKVVGETDLGITFQFNHTFEGMTKNKSTF